MLLTSVLQSLALALSVSASPVAHLHHAHKRDVVHVTETVMVTVGGANTNFDQAPAATQTTIDSQPTEGTQTAYAYQVTVLQDSDDNNTATASTSTPVKNFETQAAAAAATSSEETTSSSTSAAPTSTSSSSSSNDDTSGAFSAGSKGLTYSPYNSDGTCKDLESVKSDLEKLADYSLIRLYGVDCNQVENVLQAKKDGQKLFLGIFFVDQLEEGLEQIANAINSYGSWDDVHTVSIGNELVNDGSATPSQIGSYVSQGRSILKSHGYNGAVVSVDTHVAIINNPELCQYSDYIAFNAHAYWDGSIVGADAGPWLLLQMQRVWSACGGKDVLCTESGWPHAGDNNGVAVASKDVQAAAIKSIQTTCGDDTIVFTAFDDLWKQPGSKNCEQYWGIY